MTEKRPNVVLIIADDLGWGDLGCNGATLIPTPHTDRIAREGLTAGDAHSASSVCTPSRYALLTGRYAWRSPMKSGVLLGHGAPLIEPGRPTIASVLSAAGYATGAFGKWHLGLDWARKDPRDVEPLDEQAHGIDGSGGAALSLGEIRDIGNDIDYSLPFRGGPVDLGFDRFFGISASLDMAPYCVLDQDRALELPDRPKRRLPGQRPGFQTPGWEDDQVDLRCAREAADWMTEQAGTGSPFFLYLATTCPHRPCVPPEHVRGRTGIGARADHVCLFDEIVGQIDEALQAAGAADDTLLIVTSDNGAPTGFPEDGDVVTHRPNGPYRGQKADIWEGGHREPLLVRWPGRVPPGAGTDQLIGLNDLFSTIASAAGALIPRGAAEDSVDQLAAITGEPPSERPALVHHSFSGVFAVRMGSWKVEFGTGSGGGFSRPPGRVFDRDHPEGQLYHLGADPGETMNLWDERPDIVAEAYDVLRGIVRDPEHGLDLEVPLR
ncbi:arylsulfatase [Brachybacterium sp. YJGR34]|uniref:sulfatase family protein n=1 Tax=Brachybacterium sp. YJGR34 TaxID=2059911 RepID=UPI000E0BB257|nr:arylsulfatase [Brachybacterium sp. YJGR34]